ncbi:PTS sugar transporter subunit IIC [Clostridium sp. MCC353]|uniref:PTS transporter subunit IIC n=1 Tax=Clostridium sp. MCC353 TaxID=2592646 RepID=UPI001C0344FD|nr:PTS sugar transporter subunit IIC [Clostridium sp. MCC353]MBT9775685.1 PTS sugar transporter subunit IIC [Clostridium sp. MCC353]
MEQTGVKGFLKRKNVNITVKTYLIDALGAMAFGLFASLLIGTIFATLGEKTHVELFTTIADYAKSATGAALGVSIAHALGAPQLVLFSAATVGIAGNALGGPVGALVSTIVAAELGKIVSKETRVDILVTPGVTIISGVLMAQFVGPGVSAFMTAFGNLVKTATEMQPFAMGILVSALIGIALTLPISSAAICIMLGLDGLAGGAATAGCCAQMVGFAVLSFRENGVGGLLAQGLGTSMLQMGNIVKNPKTWIPPTLASMVTGPIATVVFQMQNIPTGAGMGTCGLVGPIGVYTAMGGGSRMWTAILLVCFVLPAGLTLVFGEVLRKMEWIKLGDLKLDL